MIPSEYGEEMVTGYRRWGQEVSLSYVVRKAQCSEHTLVTSSSVCPGGLKTDQSHEHGSNPAQFFPSSSGEIPSVLLNFYMLIKPLHTKQLLLTVTVFYVWSTPVSKRVKALHPSQRQSTWTLLSALKGKYNTK